MNKKVIGNLMLTLTAIIWGTAFVAQRVGMESIEPITFTAARMYLAFFAVGLVAWLSGRKEKEILADKSQEEVRAYKKNTLLGGICCGFFLVTATIFQQMGLVYTTAGKAGFITALYILLVPIISFIFFKKKNSWLVWFAVLMGVAGMYLLCMNEGFYLTHGDSLVCVCAFLFSGHILSCDYFTGRGNPLRISAIQFLTASLISTVLAFFMESPAPDKVISAAVPILYCGIVSGGIGYTLQMVAQRYTDPVVASLLMSMESVFAVIAGALLIHERMTLRELAGCLVIFIAIILVQIPVGNRKESS